ncbi:MAG: hypothetical protein FWE83_08720 [Oscillospiraceae bacterium]|jgi:hypothetical protein|nr:hypothetical protein [Oscillospiraceae bacterium]
MSQTRFLSVRELQKYGSSIKDILDDDGNIVITSNGKPIGFTVGIDESTFEDVLEDWKRVKQIRHLRFIDSKLDSSLIMAADPNACWISDEAFWTETEASLTYEV